MNEIFILGFAQEGAGEPIKCGKCEPCICRDIPGLVYDADINGCAWPDESGCKLSGDSKHFSRFFTHCFYT